MNKVLIETYRGFDIEFDTDNAKFQCIVEDGYEKNSSSFYAVRKWVDDYHKENVTFKPFEIESIPGHFYYGKESKKLKVIGIRKDGAFMVEDAKGKKQQLSKYDLDKYMLVEPRNSVVMAEWNANEELWDKLRNENEMRKKLILAKLQIKTAKEVKQEMDQ